MPENRRVFNLSAHKALWTWLAEHPDKEKEDWVGWKENGGEYDCVNNCFACQYARVMMKEAPLVQSHFGKCPLLWGVEGEDNEEEKECYFACEEYETLYSVWQEEVGEERAELAKKIANMRVREGVRTL